MNDYKKIISGVKAHLKMLEAEGITAIPVKRRFRGTAEMSPEVPVKGRVDKREYLLRLKRTTDACVQCKALVRNRTRVVFGSGHANARLMFVGEAPGHEEDRQGLPFVGRAGVLLTKMIESIGLSRGQIFIANVLKCRPPQNRNPYPEEIMNCEPYLCEQIDIIKPKIICALGTFAAQTLLKTDTPISRLRGAFHSYHNTKLLPTFHPAYLLRNASEKRKAWEDFKLIKKELGL